MIFSLLIPSINSLSKISQSYVELALIIQVKSFVLKWNNMIKKNHFL